MRNVARRSLRDLRRIFEVIVALCECVCVCVRVCVCMY